MSLGLGVDLLQYYISGVGSRHVITVQFGSIIEIMPKLIIGLHIFNINQAKITKSTNERLPVVMKGGFSYLPTEEFMINVELEKNINFPEIIKVGFEYRVIETVYFRSGINLYPMSVHFGLGLVIKKLVMDYAFSNNNPLGSIHEISLSRKISR